MNICNGPEKVVENPVLKNGHLYQCESLLGDDIFIYYCTGALVNLKDGAGCSGNNGYGSLNKYQWRDVTDSYCLQKVE